MDRFEAMTMLLVGVIAPKLLKEFRIPDMPQKVLENGPHLYHQARKWSFQIEVNRFSRPAHALQNAIVECNPSLAQLRKVFP